jgi:branched-chain amino acid transport system permease protein
MSWIGLTRGPMGIPGIPPVSFFGFDLKTNFEYYYLILFLDIIVIFLISRIVDSRVGRTFVAIREDELAAQSISIDTFRAKVLSFILATFFLLLLLGFPSSKSMWPTCQRRRSERRQGSMG